MVRFPWLTLRCPLALLVGLCLSIGAASGCLSSSTPPTSSPPKATGGPTTPAHSEGTASTDSGTKSPSRPMWEDYPDVPKFEVMSEVDGIKLPRLVSKGATFSLSDPIPPDVGNEHAKKKPSEPAKGDTLIVRFQSEPKVLNSITENSAVQNYINQYVKETLAHQNPETFAYEPAIASKWVVEDSIKLSPDYAQGGRIRRIVMDEGQPAKSIEINYELPAPVDGQSQPPPKIKLTTTDEAGKPLGGVWVGVYPVGRILGASATGSHYWSNSDGIVEIGGFPTGKYTVKVGAELIGKATKEKDGSLVVTAETEENDLRRDFPDGKLTLKPEEWIDVQAETYTTYYLRDSVTWSDGKPFTTKDIEFAYALLNNPSVDGDAIRVYYSDLVECRALGPHVVRMKYRQQYFKSFEFTYGISYFAPPFHFFENLFAAKGKKLSFERLTDEQEASSQQVSIHGKQFGKFFNTDETYNRSPMGTGQYIVKSWTRGDRVELVRNENYWNKEKAGHVDRIVVRFIPDQVAAMSAFKAGEIDFFYDMSPEQYFEDWPLLEEEIRNNYVLGSWYSPMFQYFGWNHRSPLLKDRRVRIALTLLLDREEFLKTKYHGAGVLVSGTQYLFGPGYDHEVSPLGYDVETAKELLTEAGWIDSNNDGLLDKDGTTFSLKLQLPKGKAINLQLAEVLQRNLKSVGIELTIIELEWASFLDNVKAKKCDVVLLRWAMPIESDPFQIWHSSGAKPENRGSNSISFANAEADELIEQMRVTLDEQKRKRIHQSFHRILDAEQPYTFLWVPKEFGAYHKRFRNVKWYRLRPGFDLSEWYVPKDEQRTE